MALGGALGLGLGARDAAAFCVAGAAHTHIYRHFAWQARHILTSTGIWRGRRGTHSHLPSFCMAGVAQTHIYRRFAWQAWHRWQHKLTSTFVLRGSDMFSASFRLFFWLVYVCHVPACLMVFRHVLWSLWHVLFSDMLPASLRLFCWLAYACPAPAFFLVAPACCFY